MVASQVYGERRKLRSYTNKCWGHNFVKFVLIFISGGHLLHSIYITVHEMGLYLHSRLIKN